jgi:predicted nucleic acid-binding Zn ribbon protein
VDKVVDTVDNPRTSGANEKNMPPTVSQTPLGARPSGVVVPSPGDKGGETVGRHDEVGRGADIAREALRAAREASAKRAAQRSADGTGKRAAGMRGRRRRWSGPGPDDRDPQPFGRLISRVSLDRGWSPRLTDATVMGRWPELVGPDVADHCTPLSLRDGELVLQAESTAWATQLRTLQRQLLERLAGSVGRGVVRRIRVVGPSSPSWRHGPRHVRGRGPRDTYG